MRPWFWLILSVPVAAVSLCGSREPWTMGLVAVLMSLCYVLRPPTRSMNRLLGSFLLAVPFLALTAFLPLSTGSEPFWRTALETEHGIPLGHLLTPQPWITFEGWVVLLAGTIWLAYCLGQDFGRQEVRVATQIFTVFIALLGVVSIGLLWSKREIPLWRGEWNLAYFGPFPNRNHFGGLLAIGAVFGFAAAYDSIQRKRAAMGFLYGLCVIPMFAAMLLNTSRMGVLLFFGGVSLWMAVATSKRYTKAQVAVALSLLLLLASGFILFGNAVIGRLQLMDGSLRQVISSEGRIGIYLDTIRMVAISPWAGVGLGNFEPVFSMTRESIDTESRALHPESDWLWLASEAGLPCMICALVVALTLTVTRGPWRKRQNMTTRRRRLSVTAGVAALILPAQSLVDTPLHGIGLASLAVLLIGLAGNGVHVETPHKSRSLPSLWTGAGVLIGSLGFTVLVSGFTGSVVSPQARFDQLSKEAVHLKSTGDNAAAVQTWNKAASIKPLQWNLYFERAQLNLALGYSSQAVLADFSRARYLEQTYGRMCMKEVEIWFQYDPPYAIPALREAISRDPTRAYFFYHWAAKQLDLHPELRPALRSLATTPSYQFVYLSFSTGEEFRSALKDFLERHPKLEDLKPDDRLKLFQLWHERGDASELLRRLEEDPAWLRDGWPIVAEHRAKSGDFQGAYMLAYTHLPKPTLRSRESRGSTESLQRLFLLNPNDPLAGLDLYWAQKASGNLTAALATLKEVALLKNAPVGVPWEMATLLADTGDYLHAWSMLQEYSRRISSPS